MFRNQNRWWQGLFGFNAYNDPPPPPTPATFTQEQVDAIVAKEKREHQTKQQTLTTQLEELKKTEGLTKKQKDDLQKQIDDLQQQYLTKEQLAAQKLDAERAAEKKTLEELSQDRDGWRGRFESTTVENAIIKAASDNEVFSAEQIKDLLIGRAKVVEEKDEHGKVKGFNVLIKTTILDKKTNLPVPVEIPVDEAIKQMKAQPEKYGNLFKSGVTGGVGGSSGKGGKPITASDIATMSDAEYKAWRQQEGISRKKGE